MSVRASNLFNALKKDSRFQGLPDNAQDFYNGLQNDPAKAQSLHKALVNSKSYQGIPSSFEEFESGLGLKKKEPLQKDLPARPKSSTQHFEELNAGTLKLDGPKMRQPVISSSGSDLEKGDEVASAFNSLFGKVNKVSQNVGSLFGYPDFNIIPKETAKKISTGAGRIGGELSSIQKKIDGFKDNFYNGSLTAEDVKINRENPLIQNAYPTGYTDQQVADLINNKTLNIKGDLGAFDATNAERHLKKIDDIEVKEAQLKQQINDINADFLSYYSGDRKKTPILNPDIKNLMDQIEGLNVQKEIVRRGQDSLFKHKNQTEYQPKISQYISEKYGDPMSWYKKSVGGEPSSAWEPMTMQKMMQGDSSKLPSESTITPFTGKQDIQKIQRGESKPDFDPATKQLTARSREILAKEIKSKMDEANDFVAKAQEQGTQLLNGGDAETQYNQIVDSYINNINNTVPVNAEVGKYTDSFVKSNPKIKPLIDNQGTLSEFYSNYKAVNAYVRTAMDAGIININSQFQSEIEGHPAYRKIIDSWNEKVKSGFITPEVAQNNINTEEKSNPELKVLFDKRDKAVNDLRNKGNDLSKQYIIKNLKNTNGDIVVYPSGNIGIKGMSEKESTDLLNQYFTGHEETVNNTLSDIAKRTSESSDDIIRRKGVFTANADNSINQSLNAMFSFIYAKTGIGGDQARMFRAKSQTERLDAGELHKLWEDQGIFKNLVNPNFYAANIGSSLPIMAGTTGVALTTQGAGLPSWLSTLGTAGLFTTHNALNTYNNLVENGVDANGRKLNASEAAVATANQIARELPFDIGMNYLHLGMVGNKITKPTVLKSIGNLAKGAGNMAAQMIGQGFISKTEQEKAEGKDQTGLIDYISSEEGMAALASSLAFLPMEIRGAVKGHIGNMVRWRSLLDVSNAEFVTNAYNNNAIQFEMGGKGGYYRDGLKLKLLNEDFSSPIEKNEIKKALEYSERLSKNAKAANLSTSNVNGLWAAHNLSMADMYSSAANSVREENPTLAKSHETIGKKYSEEAQKAMEGKSEFYYMVDNNNQPVFLSKDSFEAMQANGDIKRLMQEGTIKDVVKNNDPEFSTKVRQQLISEPEVKPDEPEIAKPLPTKEPGPISSINQIVGSEVEYNTPLGKEIGTLEKNENGEYVVNVGEKEYVLPVADKNNPTESLEQLGVKQLPEITLSEDQLKNIQKDAERAGKVSSNNGNEFFISLANPENPDAVGDQVMLIDKKGKYKEVPGMTEDTKLSLINKFLAEQGLPARKNVVYPKKGEENVSKSAQSKVEASPEIKKEVQDYAQKENIPLTEQQVNYAAGLVKESVTAEKAVGQVVEEAKTTEKVKDSKDSIENIQKVIDKEMGKEKPNLDKVARLEESRRKEVNKAIESKFGMKSEDIVSSLGERIKYVDC